MSLRMRLTQFPEYEKAMERAVIPSWESVREKLQSILTQFSMIRSAPESNKSWMISRHPFEQA
jgi:hypothetical protein